MIESVRAWIEHNARLSVLRQVAREAMEELGRVAARESCGGNKRAVGDEPQLTHSPIRLVWETQPRRQARRH